MLDRKSEDLRSALSRIRVDIRNAMQLTDATSCGDRVPIRVLDEMYLRASALLAQLQSGDWNGRTVVEKVGPTPLDSTIDRWNSFGRAPTYRGVASR